MITVRLIDSIFEPHKRRTQYASPHRKLLDYVPQEWQNSPQLRIIHNDQVVDRENWANLAEPGDLIICYLIPGDPATIVTFVVLSLVVVGISYAVQALTAPSRKSMENDLDNSPTYNFDGQVNTVRPGTRIPIIYGKHRVGGHILQQFIRPARDRGDTPADPKAGELHTLIGLCTGPIAGVDDVMIDGSDAKDYDIAPPEVRLGYANQAAITGFNDVVRQFSKDVLVTQTGGSVTFTTNDQVDAFEIIFRFAGGLYKVNSAGGYNRKTVKILVEHREVGAVTWIPTGVKTVTEKAPNTFDAFFDSGRLDRASYEIRVTRQTEDDNRATGFSEFKVLALNDVTEDVLTYPRVALLAIRQLPTNRVQGRTPVYTSLVRGKIVKVYSNLTTYTAQWSDNPAWCLLDLLTNPLDGLGPWIKSTQVDLQSFIDSAAFCASKDFKLNLVLDGSLPAIDAIKQMCVAGRLFFLHRGGKWALRPETTESPVQLFTMGRIGRGSFSVQKTSKLSLANYFVGQYWNEDANYEPDSWPMEDPTLLEGDDQREKTVNLLGVTRTVQVDKLLRYYMLANRLNRRVIELEVGAEAIALEAGDVFKVAHDVPAWSGYSGKLRAVDGAGGILTLDREITLEVGKTYEITVIHDSDTIDVLVVTNPTAETTSLISVSGDWTTIPRVEADYAIGEVDQSTKLYRCVSITQGSAPWIRKLRAVEYNAAVYGEDVTVLPSPITSKLPDPDAIPPDVTNLQLQERQFYAEDGTLTEAIDVFWNLPVIQGIKAQVFWREFGAEGWDPVGPETTFGYYSIRDNVQTPGVTYEVSVVSVSASGVRKDPEKGVRSTVTTVGVTRQPDVPAGFRVDRTVTGLVFNWDPIDAVKNFDLDYYEIRVGTQWETAVLVGTTSNTFFETAIFGKGQQTFLLKAVNTAGKSSATPAAVVISVSGRIGENVILTRTEETAWNGTKQNFVVQSGELVMDTVSDIVSWRGRTEASFSGTSLRPGGFGASFRSTGIYTTAAFQITSSNAVRTIVSTHLLASQVDVNLYWTATGVADQYWTSEFGRSRKWAEAPDGRVRLRVQMRFSTATSSDSDFGPWQERPQAIEVTVKWAQVRLLAEVLDPAFTVKIKEFSIIFDVPDIVDSGTISTSSVGTVAVTFAKAYNNAPKVTATVHGATAGDDIFITSLTSTGFNIEVKNGGSGVVRTVHWNAIGF